ncbi:RsmE family RNA methyltransferase [Porphyromonas pogonae]|uniref:RsmE family RNA methyltransferase n=1 Tax=Porphyromonas pogonae TaxID=867595 RepID=UPI002E76B2A9|nr:RsmE family RNA methyltransferase [Porphyromonas pogonae]
MKGMTELPLFYAPEIGITGQLPEPEAMHCGRVLRKQVGDQILITDGHGKVHVATIVSLKRQECMVSIDQTTIWSRNWNGPIVIAIAPTKNLDRMEWMVEKLVEIGIDGIVFLKTEHSERKTVKPERIERVMISAMKQSLKAVLPALEVDVPFIDFVKRPLTFNSGLIAHCVDDASLPLREIPASILPPGSGATILIGPEGDFSLKEIELAVNLGYHGITLGDSRLRAETAGIVACQWVHTLQQIEKQKDKTHNIINHL